MTKPRRQRAVPADLDMTVDEEIARVEFGRPHVVILGAGASLAAFPDGEGTGRRLPVMSNFAETLGLEPQLDALGLDHRARNFEDVLSDLVDSGANSERVAAIESRIHEYFFAMRLPLAPTLYDYLVLSLRDKDVIATFNWDPLLFAACARAHQAGIVPPRILHLHGSVAVGWCHEHRTAGSSLATCSRCQKRFEPVPLLYPVRRKNYSAHPYLSLAWSELSKALKNAWILTVFGYGAPSSDVDAVAMLTEAWGPATSRELEETEIIDIRAESELRQTWSPFIHTHHYRVERDFLQSWLAHHPRRSCEAMWAQLMECRFVSKNSLPRVDSYGDLVDSIRPMLAAERKAR